MSVFTIEESLARLDAVRGDDWEDDPDFLAELLSHGPAIAPALAERIAPEALTQRGTERFELDSQGWICCAVLCDLAVPETAPAVVAALFRGTESQDGDDLDWFLMHLWQFGLALEAPLRDVIQSPDSYWFVHSAAVNTLTEVAGYDVEARQRTIEFFRAEIEVRAEKTEESILKVTQLATGLRLLSDRDSLPLIEKLFDEGWIDAEDYETKDEFTKEFDHEPFVQAREPFLPSYRKEVEIRKQYQAQIKADNIRQKVRAERDVLHSVPLKPVTVAKKPGRNEPCWCGSGKKYKKCHIDEDQKKR